MKLRIALLATLALLAARQSSAGIDVPVTNYSFESPALTNGDYQGDGNYPAPFTIPGWGSDGANGNGVQNFIGTGAYGNGSVLPGTADGKQAVYVNSSDVYQDVGKLLANTTYTLTVAAGNQPGYGPGSSGEIELVNGSNAGGALLSGAPVGPNGDPNHPLAIGNFTDFTTTFTTGGSVSGDLTIVLAKTSGNQVDYDNVRLTASTTPEPASLVVWGLVIAGGIVVSRRRRGA